MQLVLAPLLLRHLFGKLVGVGGVARHALGGVEAEGGGGVRDETDMLLGNVLTRWPTTTAHVQLYEMAR